MTTRITKDMRIAAAREREAAKQRELETLRKQPEPGSVVVFFRERQSKPRWWQRTRELHFMRAFHGARYELRHTPTTSFLAIIQSSAAGPVEFLYDWKDVSRVSTLPKIELSNPVPKPNPVPKLPNPEEKTDG